MGVWEYGSMGVRNFDTKLIRLIKNIIMRVVCSGFGSEFFISILPYSHTPILVQ